MRFFKRDKQKTSEDRKRDSEKRLKVKSIPINKNLPFVEDFKSAKIRDVKDVVRRLLILSVIVDNVHGYENSTKADTIEWFKKVRLWDYVSDEEKEYLTSDKDVEKKAVQLSWRTESMKILFWAIGLIDKMDDPIKEADLRKAHDVSKERYKSVRDFINNSSLRDTEEILDETDYIYRVHWAIRQAGLDNKNMPAGFNRDIVYERHYALNWLTCYADEWDEITCDT
jgi:hypothetical protein